MRKITAFEGNSCFGERILKIYVPETKTNVFTYKTLVFHINKALKLNFLICFKTPPNENF